MHELAICESVLRRVLAVAASQSIHNVARIALRTAALDIEIAPIEVRCQICDSTSSVRPSRRLCATCGTWRVNLVSGEEILSGGTDMMDAPLGRQMERIDV